MGALIVTLTLNPAVDQTIFVRGFQMGEVNRFHESHLDPAGKGINVSRMAHRLGWPTIAFGFVAGEIGRFAEHALEDEGVPFHPVRVPGQTRLNITVVDEALDKATSFFGPGPVVDDEHREGLDGFLRFWLPVGRVLVLAGSLPRGVPADLYATYIRMAHDVGLQDVFLDAEGEALRLGMAAHPFLIKPNVAEAERLLGRALLDLDAISRAAVELMGEGIPAVVISMGSQGCVCAHGQEVWLVAPPEVPRRSTVGSGDSMVAGLAVAQARGETIVEGLRLGTAAGAATAMTPGTALGTPDDVAALLPRVSVEKIA